MSGVQYGGNGAPGDVDDDGYEDAAFVDYGTKHVYIFLGPPTTGLTTSDAWASATGTMVTAGDTDGDGSEELFVGATSTIRRYAFPIPSGALSDDVAAISYGASTNELISPNAGIDFSADGYGDLIFAYSGSGTDYVRMFEGGVE